MYHFLSFQTDHSPVSQHLNQFQVSMESAFSKSFTKTLSWLLSTVAKPPMTTTGFHLPSSLKRRTPVSRADIMGAWLAKIPSCPVALGKITYEKCRRNGGNWNFNEFK